MNIPFILWTACVLEFVTYILRSELGIHSKSVQKTLKLPIRVHHMYIGLFLVIPGYFYTTPLFPDPFLGGTAITLLDLGVTIAFSDILHHFGILPLFEHEIDFP